MLHRTLNRHWLPQNSVQNGTAAAVRLQHTSAGSSTADQHLASCVGLGTGLSRGIALSQRYVVQMDL